MARHCCWYARPATGSKARSPPPARQEETAAEFLATARRRVAAILPELPVTEKITSEPPAKALMEAADEAAVLVLGSRGLGSLAGFVVGSVSLSVIAHAQTPVVTVRGQASQGRHRRRRRRLPAELRAVAGVRLRASPPAGGGPCAPSTPGASPGCTATLPPFPTWTRSWTADAEASKRSHELLAPWQKRYPDVRTEISTGSMAIIPHLLKAGTDAALVVVGRRVRGHPFPTRIGPVTHGMLHHAACPVAVVPHE